ncbi:glycosyltransferase family 1 protein [Vibrio fortis]|uniref:glycosyltransferase family 1 protein n=1 Tax=Vibrio fortis TaxID=212667 RepID=UPI002F3F0BE1
MCKDQYLIANSPIVQRKVKKQTIAFIIGTFGHGRGGHFWDLKTISETLKSQREVIVFNIGVSSSPVLEQANVNVVNLPLNAFISVREIKKIVKEHNIGVIYSIDSRVDFISSIVCDYFKIPLIIIKPGGPNPKGTYPVMQKMIVYSAENYQYFSEKAGYDNKEILFIPNRSSIVNINKKYVDEIEQELPGDCFKFIQVIRIAPEYYNNLVQSIELVNRLTNISDINVALVIIGVVQDEMIMEELKQKAKGLPVYFFANNEYTKSASELLSVGDAVIANGRSVMEASSLNLPILVSAKNTEIPVLLNDDVFNSAFKVNFSPRFECPKGILSEEDNLEAILNLIDHESHLIKNKNFSKECFDKHFNIASVVDQYIEISDASDYMKTSLKSKTIMMKKYISSVIKTWAN